jgi:hypothetical protein
VHIERSGTLRVNLPLGQAFHFFSPEGERRWIAGWDPNYLHPSGAPSEAPGTVFETHHNNEHTLWLVLRFSAADGVADYVRITPGSRMGLVTVRASEHDGATEVEVRYSMTSLADAGARALEAFTDEAYAAMLRHWEALISRAAA